MVWLPPRSRNAASGKLFPNLEATPPLPSGSGLAVASSNPGGRFSNAQLSKTAHRSSHVLAAMFGWRFDTCMERVSTLFTLQPPPRSRGWCDDHAAACCHGCGVSKIARFPVKPLQTFSFLPAALVTRRKHISSYLIPLLGLSTCSFELNPPAAYIPLDVSWHTISFWESLFTYSCAVQRHASVLCPWLHVFLSFAMQSETATMSFLARNELWLPDIG